MSEFKFYNDGVEIEQPEAEKLFMAGENVTVVDKNGRVYNACINAKHKVEQVFNPEKTVTKYEINER